MLGSCLQQQNADGSWVNRWCDGERLSDGQSFVPLEPVWLDAPERRGVFRTRSTLWNADTHQVVGQRVYSAWTPLAPPL
jgi:hypothetical protein